MDLIKFYPIANVMLPLDVSNLDWSTQDSYTLSTALSNSGYSYTEITDESNPHNHYFKDVRFIGNNEYSSTFGQSSSLSIVELQDFKAEPLPTDHTTDEWAD